MMLSHAVKLARRGIYLHAGPRVAGLKRDPAHVLAMPHGTPYGSSEATKHIHSFLGSEYAIPDDVALQVLTHKLFSHGLKPYNEKLSAMGSKLLNLYLAKHVVEQQTLNPLAVNGKNIDVLGSPMARELTGRMAAGLFAKNAKLNEVMFWRLYNHEVSFEQSGEMKVSAQMVYALVGAVTFLHGKSVAERFIREKLLLGDKSLEKITVEMLEQQ